MENPRGFFLHVDIPVGHSFKRILEFDIVVCCWLIHGQMKNLQGKKRTLIVLSCCCSLFHKILP
jgi:hypothetical protein